MAGCLSFPEFAHKKSLVAATLSEGDSKLTIAVRPSTAELLTVCLTRRSSDLSGSGDAWHELDAFGANFEKRRRRVEPDHVERCLWPL